MTVASCVPALAHCPSNGAGPYMPAAAIGIALAVSAVAVSVCSEEDEGLSAQWPWRWFLPSARCRTPGVVAAGCFLNVVLTLGLLHFARGGTDLLRRKSESGGGKVQVLKGREVPALPPQQTPGEAIVKVQEADKGFLWPLLWQCGCCARDPSDKETEFLQDVVPTNGSELWLHSEKHMHPKFCGLRLQEPSGRLPDLARFPAEPRGGGGWPDDWGHLLRCTEDERRLCGELKAQVAAVDGPKDPVTMLRFLRARQRVVPKAAAMYTAAMKWREENGLEKAFREGALDDTLHKRVDAHWPPTALLGHDRDGDPTYWNRMGVAPVDFLAEASPDFLYRHEVYSITRVLQAMEEYGRRVGRPVMYMTVIVDLKHMGPRFLNFRVIPKFKMCARILEDYYPEMVKRIVVINAPRVAYTLWNIASTFFDEGTRSKIQIASANTTFETLNGFIDEKWIPEALGGSQRVGCSPYCEPIIPKPQVPFPQDVMESVRTLFPMSAAS